MKISIITINYNDKEGLKKTILSVINQINVSFEYIIIDGGSNDGSIDVINKFRKHFSYYVSEPDQGIYNAMNKGIRKAKGEYLLFLNGGDLLIENENILSNCCKYLKEDIVSFNCYLEKEGEIVGIRRHIEFPTLFYIYKNGLIKVIYLKK